MTESFAEGLRRSQELGQMGQHRQQFQLLEQLLKSASSADERVIAAQIGWSVFAEKILGARAPAPATPDYETFHRLLQEADDAYPAASPEVRSRFDAADARFGLRHMLAQTQRGLPIEEEDGGDGRARLDQEYAAAKSGLGRSILAWIVIIGVLIALGALFAK